MDQAICQAGGAVVLVTVIFWTPDGTISVADGKRFVVNDRIRWDAPFKGSRIDQRFEDGAGLTVGKYCPVVLTGRVVCPADHGQDSA